MDTGDDKPPGPEDGDHRLSCTGAGTAQDSRLGAEAKQIIRRELRGVGE